MCQAAQPATRRAVDGTRPTTERAKTNDSTFTLDPTRRSVGDRHSGRSTSNGEDAALGANKVGFASMRSLGTKFGGDSEKPFRDQESRGGFGLRVRSDQSDSTSYTTSGGFGNSTSRDTRNPAYRRRGDGDQDNEGWSTVKPRHSFGHEGAERFHGRMGGVGSNSNNTHDRFSRDDRKSARDRDDSDYNIRDRPRRTFDRDFGRDGDDNADGTRRNGPTGRGPWFKDTNGGANDERLDRQDRPTFDRTDRPSQRDRISQAKNWRERDPNNQPLESFRERNNNDSGSNGFDRRWDRDRGGDRDYYQQQRVEREPEWMDEDITFADDKPSSGGHTAEDLRRFIEEMKGLRPGASTEKLADASAAGNGAGALETAPKSTIDTGKDRFFEQFAKPSKAEEADVVTPKETKAKAGKSSRFTSFFSTQEDSRRHFEPQMPAVTNAPPQSPPPNAGTGPAETPDAAEKEAFQALLQKLQRQTISGVGGDGTASLGPSPSAVGGFSIGGMSLGGPVPSNSNSNANLNSVTPPNPNAFQGPPNTAGLSTPHGSQPKSAVVSPEPSRPQSKLQSGTDLRDESLFRPGLPPMSVQQGMQEALLQRQQPMRSSQSPPSSVRPEQMIQELLMQRQQAARQEAGASRLGPTGSGPNPNTEFLMKLMQSHNGPDSRNFGLVQEDLFLRGSQPPKAANGPPAPDREAEIAELAAAERERMGLRQQMRLPPGPPGLFNEDQFHRQDMENRPPPQPTQILQRPPPPGVEHNLHGPPPPPAFLQQQHFLQQQQQQHQQQQQQLQAGAGGGGGRMQPQQAPPPGSQQPMIAPPGLGMGPPGNPPNRTMPNMPGIPGMPPMPNMPPMHNMHMPPNLLNMPPNMPNMPNMPPPMPNMPPMPGMMFPPNFSPNGPFHPDGAPTGLPRNMHPPPPEFYNGPPGPNGPNGPPGPPGPPPPGFMPPLGMGFQGPPMDGVPFPFNDGRGMPQQPPPPGIGGFRRA